MSQWGIREGRRDSSKTRSDCRWQALQCVKTDCCQLHSSQSILPFQSGTWQQTRIFLSVRPDTLSSDGALQAKTFSSAPLHPSISTHGHRIRQEQSTAPIPQCLIFNVLPRVSLHGPPESDDRSVQGYTPASGGFFTAPARKPRRRFQNSPRLQTSNDSITQRFELSGDLRLSEIRRRAVSTSNTVTFTICPTATTSEGSRTKWSASCEI